MEIIYVQNKARKKMQEGLVRFHKDEDRVKVKNSTGKNRDLKN